MNSACLSNKFPAAAAAASAMNHVRCMQFAQASAGIAAIDIGAERARL
jgi:hypothetical protein